MPKGTVKWFNNAKGYGFILSEESGGDIFAHYSAIEMDGYKTLKAGQVVSFELIEGAKGVHAAHIRADGAAVNEHAPGATEINGHHRSTTEVLDPISAAENFNH
tara:strand:+ start:2008 stop:2319 length:312 start_codon:yes stop_codon:yes gene_type:complete